MQLKIVEYLEYMGYPQKKSAIRIAMKNEFRKDISAPHIAAILSSAIDAGYITRVSKGIYAHTPKGVNAMRQQFAKEKKATNVVCAARLEVFSENHAQLLNEMPFLPSKPMRKPKNLKPSYMWAQIQVERNGGEFIEPTDQFLPS